MENRSLLIVSNSPHIQNSDTVKSIMFTVTLFLLPAAIFGVYIFGFYSLLVIVSSIITSVITEALIQYFRKVKITINDGSAILTGLLIGMNMPPHIPLYIPIISSIFAIAIVKQAFGGIGQNWANPAIAARVFAFISWSKEMTTWQVPLIIDSASSATPLTVLKSAIIEGKVSNFSSPIDLLNSNYQDILKIDISYLKLFFGYKAGCIGEVSVFLLLVGAAYLIYKKIITLDIPLSYIITFSVLIWIFDGVKYNNGVFFTGDVFFHLLTGGLILGAFFMATDMVTTPITKKGRLIFGVGCGLLTFLIREFGGFPEGVSLSILFMNMLTPLIDRFIKVSP